MDNNMKFTYFIPLILFIFLLFPFALEYIPKNDVLGGIVYLLFIMSMITLPIICVGAFIMYFLGYFPNYFKSTYPYVTVLFIIYKTL